MSKAILRKANIVVLANNYNPSIISKDWVMSKQLLNKPIGNFVHTPAFSLIENDNFSLAVDMDRLQLSVKEPHVENLKLMRQIIKKFFTLLPETPYRAMGFNFIYELQEEGDFLSNIISPKEQNIKKLFSTTYDLGAIISFKFRGLVARANISPAKPKQKAYTVNFNFHTDIQDTEQAKGKLDLYERVLQETERILRE